MQGIRPAGDTAEVNMTLQKLFSVKTVLAVGAFLLISGAFLGWVNQPITGWIAGYKLKLSGDMPPVLSYGLLSLLAGVLAFISMAGRLKWLGVAAGLFGIFVAMHFFFSFSLTDSIRIVQSSDLNQQEKRILSFNRFLPPNNGIEPTFEQNMTSDTILSRFYDTLHFATLGWYAAILGSGLVFGASLISGSGRPYRSTVILLSALLLLTYGVITLFPYLTAEYHRNRGDYYLAAGMYSRSLDEYETARKMDRNINYLKWFHLNKGKACYFSGKSDMADYYIYRATLQSQEANFPLAIFYLNLADTVKEPIPKPVWKSLVSWTYVNYGLSQYRRGMPAPAIDLWKKSIETDASQIQPYYYLSRAYYDMSGYEESIAAGMEFLRRSRNTIMNANASSNIADSYYRLKMFSPARDFYLKSQFLDKFENLRAIMSLVGR